MALQLSSRTLLTEFNMPNPDGAFSLGICCTIELHIRRKTPSYKVPPMRSFSMKPGLQVAVVENGVARLRKLAVGCDVGQQIEVNSGVKRGNQVVLDPAVDLVGGSKGTDPTPADADILTPRRMPQATTPNGTPILKPYLMVRPIFRAYVFSERPTALAPGGGVQMAAEWTAHATSYAPECEGRAPSGSLMVNGETHGICRLMILWNWSRASIRLQECHDRAMRMLSRQSRIS
jgi:hypothetical protein